MRRHVDKYRSHIKNDRNIHKTNLITMEFSPSPKKKYSPMVGEIKHELGMFKSNNNEDDIDYNKSSKTTTTTTSDNNNKNHDKSKIIDRRLKPKIEKNEVDTDSILQRILSKRPFPIEVIRMKEKKELEAKDRKIRNIKRGLKGLGTSPIRTKKMNATRPEKKTSIKSIKQSPLVRRTKRRQVDNIYFTSSR